MTERIKEYTESIFTPITKTLESFKNPDFLEGLFNLIDKYNLSIPTFKFNSLKTNEKLFPVYDSDCGDQIYEEGSDVCCYLKTDTVNVTIEWLPLKIISLYLGQNKNGKDIFKVAANDTEFVQLSIYFLEEEYPKAVIYNSNGKVYRKTLPNKDDPQFFTQLEYVIRKYSKYYGNRS